MKKLYIYILIMAGFLALNGIADADEKFKAKLSGAEEVPAVMTDTKGKFQIKFNSDETAAEYRLKVSDGVRITQAHIHCGAEGMNGPVVVFLAGFHDLGWDVDGKWISKATVTDLNIIDTTCGTDLSELAQAMRDGNTYVNVHSVANPGGEVRGQIK
jgi:hypothetical protein